MMKSNIFELINSKIFIVFFSAILTIFGAICVSQKYQDKVWQNNKKIELWRDEIQQTRDLIDSVNKIIKERYFYLVLILRTDRNSDTFKKYFYEYNNILIKWNTNITFLRDKSIFLLDKDIAYLLLDKSNNTKENESLYTYFKQADLIVEMKNKDYHNYKSNLDKNDICDRVGRKCDYVIEKYNQAFNIKYKDYKNIVHNTK